MPVSDVLAWIAGLRGAVHAVDLSFNSLDGPVSTDICDIYANGTNVVSLRGNSFICGDIPECMRKFWDEDFLCSKVVCSSAIFVKKSRSQTKVGINV